MKSVAGTSQWLMYLIQLILKTVNHRIISRLQTKRNTYCYMETYITVVPNLLNLPDVLREGSFRDQRQFYKDAFRSLSVFQCHLVALCNLCWPLHWGIKVSALIAKIDLHKLVWLWTNVPDWIRQDNNTTPSCSSWAAVFVLGSHQDVIYSKCSVFTRHPPLKNNC